MILTIKTDDPEAQLSLVDGSTTVDTYTWHAHRELSDTLLIKIEKLVHKQGKTMAGLDGIIVYKGPGSFTGLRIGVTVANTIAYSYNLPIVGTTDSEWLRNGQRELQVQTKPIVVVPEYGQPATITQPRK